MGHTDQANKGGASDTRAPARPRIAWARLVGLVHVVQLLLAAVFVARAKGAAWALGGGAGLLCLVTLLLGVPWLLASAKTRGFAVLAAVVPALGGLAAAHSSMKQALVVYALGVTGSSLGLSFLACLSALRASSRPLRLRLGAVGIIACAIGAAGAALLVHKLPMKSMLVMAGPVVWGLVVIAVVAAAMGGAYGTRERDAPQAAFDGVNAILLALGAVGLAAVAVGALRAGVEPAATGTRAQRVWADSIKLLHQSAMSGLPILGAGAIVLGASAVRLGHGVRAWGGQTVLIATLVLGITGGCRFELSQTWRAAVRSMARHSSKSMTSSRGRFQDLHLNRRVSLPEKAARRPFAGREAFRVTGPSMYTDLVSTSADPMRDTACGGSEASAQKEAAHSARQARALAAGRRERPVFGLTSGQ